MSRSPSFSELSIKPDPESLKRWVHAFCIMRFDLEQGQLLEECYPPNRLSQEEEIEVSFNSFPEEEEVDGGDRYLYGYVFNRQRHDERLRRGGEQKSVVILSHTPYSSVFRPLLQIIGPLYFDVGNKAIELIAGI